MSQLGRMLGTVYFAASALILCSALLPANAQDIITTVAGGGPNNLSAVDANLSQPYNTAVDKAGNVYVAVAGNNRILKIATSGTVTVVAGTGISGYGGDGGAATSAELNSPYGVAVDQASPANVYISDSSNCLVRKVTAKTGIISTVAGSVVIPTSGAPYSRCGYGGDGGAANAALLGGGTQSIVVDSKTNDIYVADYGNGRVRKIAGGTPSGTITTVAGGGASLTNGNNCSGASPYGDGGPATSAYLCNPTGVAIDNSVSPANVFVADNARCTIREVIGATQDIYTVAGTINSCGFTDGVPATSAQLNDSFQLQLALSGSTTTVYIADYGNQRVRQFSLTYNSNVPAPGLISTIAGGNDGGFCGDGGPALSACIYPVGISFDATGDYYIADYGNLRVRKVAASSTTITTIAGWGNYNYSDPVSLTGATGTDLGLYQPGLFVDSSAGVMYVSGNTQAVYSVSTTTGKAATVAGNGVAGFAGDGDAANSAGTELSLPYQVAKDSTGNLYISDSNNCAIRQVSAASGLITTIAGGSTAHLNGCGFSGDGGLAVNARLSNPTGLVVDSNNNLYVADASNCVVRKITLSTGIITTVAGNTVCGYGGDGGPALSASINQPSQLGIDNQGDLYIADTNNQRIREVDAAFGTMMTVAGNGAGGYSGDGIAIENSLYSPTGLTSDANGNLFIGDRYNHILRWVGPGGTMTTIAGTPSNYGFSGDGGHALLALLNQPALISLDASGNVYFADYNNNRIRRVSAFAGYGLSTDRLIFEQQQVGTKSGVQSITLSAIGPITINGVSVTSGYAELDDCTGNSLTAGQTCQIDVRFTPATVGINDGILSVESNAFFLGQQSTVELVGEAGGLSLSGSTTFANQLDSVSTRRTMTLTNTGASAAQLTHILFEANPSFVAKGGTCPATGGTLAAGASCTVIVIFDATTPGSHQGTLAILSNDPSSPLLTGFTGESTELSVSPTSLPFGTVTDGTTATMTLHVSNSNSSAGSYTLKPAVTGAGFTILSAGNTCTAALPPGANCTLPVQFAPTQAQAYTATLTLVSGISASPTVSLSGTGAL